MSLSIVSRVPSRLALPSRGHELGGLVEPHAQSHVNRLHAQPDCEMRLAAHGLAIEHQVLRPRCNQLRTAISSHNSRNTINSFHVPLSKYRVGQTYQTLVRIDIPHHDIAINHRLKSHTSHLHCEAPQRSISHALDRL